MMILKEFSRIVCVSLFSYQGSFVLFRSLATAHLVYHVRFRLSRTFLSFFKTFVMNFCDFVDHQQLIHSIAFISKCQELFLFFLFLFRIYFIKPRKKSASSRSGFKYIIVVFIRQAFFIKLLKKFELTDHIDKEYSIRCLFRSIRGLFCLFRCCIIQSVPEMRSI